MAVCGLCRRPVTGGGGDHERCRDVMRAVRAYSPRPSDTGSRAAETMNRVLAGMFLVPAPFQLTPKEVAK